MFARVCHVAKVRECSLEFATMRSVTPWLSGYVQDSHKFCEVLRYLKLAGVVHKLYMAEMFSKVLKCSLWFSHDLKVR